ncbi:MAG: hypothetical protein MJ180_05770, partial [Candidatus Gastranaerophilales bacterium]|nr:hypothetical protein [Candidatus Gastranaerophilales bacterium]
LFGLKDMRQYNLNAVASPDFDNLVYAEVYFYPDPQVTASALYIIPLGSGLSNKEKILSVSTADKTQTPIVETDYAHLYPFKFNTYTPVDWNKGSNQILFKEKLGQNRYEVYLTKLFLYDLSQEKMFDLNLIRAKIIEYWGAKGLYLEDYKWDIHPLGFALENENNILVKAYGYYKEERKFLGLWAVNTQGTNVKLISEKETETPKVSANGKCLKFVPDMGDIFKKQRRIDDKDRQIYIEPK